MTLATATSLRDLAPNPFPTTDQLAEIIGVDVTWIHSRRREGTIVPSPLFTGTLQYPRTAIARCIVYRAMQATFGERSPLPARIVASIAGELDRSVAGEWLMPHAVERAIRLGLDRIHDTLKQEVAKKLVRSAA